MPRNLFVICYDGRSRIAQEHNCRHKNAAAQWSGNIAIKRPMSKRENPLILGESGLLTGRPAMGQSPDNAPEGLDILVGQKCPLKSIANIADHGFALFGGKKKPRLIKFRLQMLEKNPPIRRLSPFPSPIIQLTQAPLNQPLETIHRPSIRLLEPN